MGDERMGSRSGGERVLGEVSSGAGGPEVTDKQTEVTTGQAVTITADRLRRFRMGIQD
jgi:hypothetical protein